MNNFLFLEEVETVGDLSEEVDDRFEGNGFPVSLQVLVQGLLRLVLAEEVVLVHRRVAVVVGHDVGMAALLH